MAYIMTDEVYQKLVNIAGNIAGWRGPIKPDDKLLLSLTLAEVIAEMIELPNLDIDELVTAHGKHEQGAMVLASKLFSNLLKVLVNEHGGVVTAHIEGVPWYFVDERAPEVVGLIPTFLDARDERPLVKQIHARYSHGGGWRRLPGWQLNTQTFELRYTSPNPDPEDEPDPPMQPLAGAALHGEIIAVYESGWTMVVSDDGENLEVARLD